MLLYIRTLEYQKGKLLGQVNFFQGKKKKKLEREKDQKKETIPAPMAKEGEGVRISLKEHLVLRRGGWSGEEKSQHKAGWLEGRKLYAGGGGEKFQCPQSKNSERTARERDYEGGRNPRIELPERGGND